MGNGYTTLDRNGLTGSHDPTARRNVPHQSQFLLKTILYKIKIKDFLMTDQVSRLHPVSAVKPEMIYLYSFVQATNSKDKHNV